MGVTISVRAGNIQSCSNEDTVDMCYGNFYEMCGDIGIDPKPDGETVGSVPILEFRKLMEEYPVSGMFPEHVIRILRMIRIGIDNGATSLDWV